MNEHLRERGNRTRRVGAHGAALLAAVVAPLWLGGVVRAGTNEEPPGCTFASSGASIRPDPSGEVQHGDTICYDVCYSVPNGEIDSCNVTGFSADLFFPDGSSVKVVNNAAIDRGTIFCCGPDNMDPADPRCEAGLTAEDFCYVVDHAHEVTDFSGCPPDPSGASGKVVAYTLGTGNSLTQGGDEVEPCATANNPVAHGACCQPCTAECDDQGDKNECLPPRVFFPGQTCEEAACTPLQCGKCETCSPDTKTCVKDVPDCCASDEQCPTDPKCFDSFCDLATNTCELSEKFPGCCTSQAQCTGCQDCVGNVCVDDQSKCPGCQDCQGGICVDDQSKCPGCQDCVNAACVDNQAKCTGCEDCVDGVCVDNQAKCTGCEDCVDGVCVDDQSKCPGCQDCVDSVCVDNQAKCPGCQDCVNAACLDDQSKCTGCQDCVNAACVDDQSKCAGCEDCVNAACVDDQSKCPGCQDCRDAVCVDDQSKCPGCQDCVNAACVDDQAKCIGCEDCVDGVCVDNQSKCGVCETCEENTCTSVCDDPNFECPAGSECDPAAPDCCSPTGGCLHRTPGFWGTHPHITLLYLPLSNCGLEIGRTCADGRPCPDEDSAEDCNAPVVAGDPLGSSAEEMCFSNRDDATANGTSPQQLQLIRQCMAAELNMAASVDLGGSCESETINLESIVSIMDRCCRGAGSVCRGETCGQEIGESRCIEPLDMFNNSLDTLEKVDPFISPGPALSCDCGAANGNGFVNPGRRLGARKCERGRRGESLRK